VRPLHVERSRQSATELPFAISAAQQMRASASQSVRSSQWILLPFAAQVPPTVATQCALPPSGMQQNWSGAGGRAGGAGSGGSRMDAGACPNDPPRNRSICDRTDALGEVCSYPTETCTCRAGDLIAFWICTADTSDGGRRGDGG
jgi:hypothetical protein